MIASLVFALVFKACAIEMRTGTRRALSWTPSATRSHLRGRR